MINLFSFSFRLSCCGCEALWNNLSRTVTAQNPQVQAFIRSLRVGEQVDMVYEEALAISIEPMR